MAIADKDDPHGGSERVRHAAALKIALVGDRRLPRRMTIRGDDLAGRALRIAA